jgi:phage-related protein
VADNFGLKIGVEGEKEFKKALSDINQSFKVLGSEMKLATSQFDSNEWSVESLTAKNQVLAKQIDAQKDKIETLRKALENASDSFGENDKRTQQWVTDLNNAQAELNGMERELSQNEKAIDDIGDEMQNAAKQTDKFGDELDEAGDEAERSGGKFDKLGSIVKGVGAAMGAALAAIGTAAIAAGKALVDMTVEAAAYADEMITQSTVTGMSVESLQAYSYAADLVDVSLDTLTGSMAKNVKSMSNAADGSAKYAEAYDRLGVSVTNADGTLRDSEDVYWEVIDALGQVSNETERDALAMQLFGKSAQDLNPLIAQGSEGIAALTDEAKRMGAVLSEETIAKLGAFDDSVQRLKQGSEAAKRVMGTVLLPQLQDLADDGTALLGEFTSGLIEAGDDFDKISEVIGNTVGGLADMIMEHLPKIIQVGMDIVMAIGDAIVENLPTLVECASSIIMTLVEGLVESLPAITESAVSLL